MDLNIDLFTEIIKQANLSTINSLLICCKQYNEYQDNISLLKELKHMILINKCDIIVDNAAENGHINVLDWFHNSQYEFKYSKYAINCAARNGHINVLDWFHKSHQLNQRGFTTHHTNLSILNMLLMMHLQMVI